MILNNNWQAMQLVLCLFVRKKTNSSNINECVFEWYYELRIVFTDLDPVGKCHFPHDVVLHLIRSELGFSPACRYRAPVGIFRYYKNIWFVQKSDAESSCVLNLFSCNLVSHGHVKKNNNNNSNDVVGLPKASVVCVDFFFLADTICQNYFVIHENG